MYEKAVFVLVSRLKCPKVKWPRVRELWLCRRTLGSARREMKPRSRLHSRARRVSELQARVCSGEESPRLAELKFMTFHKKIIIKVIM